MSTNYYIIRKITEDKKKEFHNMIDNEQYEELQVALSIFEKENKIHIGKSSYGWKFLFNSNNFKFFEKNAESLWRFIKNNENDLYDEYGRKISYEELKDIVKKSENGLDYLTYQLKYKVQDPYLTVSDYYIDNLRFSSTTDFS